MRWKRHIDLSSMWGIWRVFIKLFMSDMNHGRNHIIWNMCKQLIISNSVLNWIFRLCPLTFNNTTHSKCLLRNYCFFLHTKPALAMIRLGPNMSAMLICDLKSNPCDIFIKTHALLFSCMNIVIVNIYVINDVMHFYCTVKHQNERRYIGCICPFTHHRYFRLI